MEVLSVKSKNQSQCLSNDVNFVNPFNGVQFTIKTPCTSWGTQRVDTYLIETPTSLCKVGLLNYIKGWDVDGEQDFNGVDCVKKP